MKRILSTLILIAACFTISYAGEPHKFDIEAYRTEQHQFVQKQASLTAEEAKIFFAIYDELRDKEREMFDRMREIKKTGIPSTDTEAKKMIIDFDNAEIELKKLQLNYHQKLLRKMPAKKLAAAIIAVSKFDRKKFSEWNGRRKKTSR